MLPTISLYITSCASVSSTQQKEREDIFCLGSLYRHLSALIAVPARSPDRVLEQDAPDHLAGVRDQVLRISDHVVRAAQHVHAVVAAAPHQVDVVLEVAQAVPLGNLPQRGARLLFRVAKHEAVDFGVRHRPAADRPHAANSRHYHRYQQAHNLHVDGLKLLPPHGVNRFELGAQKFA